MRATALLILLLAAAPGYCGLMREISGPSCGSAVWEAMVHYSYGEEAGTARVKYTKSGGRLRLETLAPDGRTESVKLIRDGKLFLYSPESKNGYIFGADDPSAIGNLAQVQINIGPGKKKEMPSGAETYRGNECIIYTYDIYRQASGRLVNAIVREWRRQKDGLVVKIECRGRQEEEGYHELFEVTRSSCRLFILPWVFDVPDNISFTDASGEYKRAMEKAGKKKGRSDK